MFRRKILILAMAVAFLSTDGSAQQKPSGYRLPLPTREDMPDEEGKKVLIGFYSTAAAELQTFGFVMHRLCPPKDDSVRLR